MTEPDDTHPTDPTRPDRAEDVADEDARADDRNELVDDSPAPDPTSGDAGARDVPGAD